MAFLLGLADVFLPELLGFGAEVAPEAIAAGAEAAAPEALAVGAETALPAVAEAGAAEALGAEAALPTAAEAGAVGAEALPAATEAGAGAIAAAPDALALAPDALTAGALPAAADFGAGLDVAGLGGLAGADVTGAAGLGTAATSGLGTATQVPGALGGMASSTIPSVAGGSFISPGGELSAQLAGSAGPQDVLDISAGFDPSTNIQDLTGLQAVAGTPGAPGGGAPGVFGSTGTLADLPPIPDLTGGGGGGTLAQDLGINSITPAQTPADPWAQTFADPNIVNAPDVSQSQAGLAGSISPTDTASAGSMLAPGNTGIGSAAPTTGASAGTPYAPAAPSSVATPAAAAPTAAKAAAAGGGGLLGGMDWKTLGLLGLGAAPLAMTLAKGEPSLPAQASQVQGIANQQQALAQQLQPAVQNYLNSVATNSPTAAQAAQLAIQQQGLVNQARQQLYNAGGDPNTDTRYLQQLQQIQQTMTASQQAMIQTNLNAALGLSGQQQNYLGGAATNLTNLAQMQINQDTAFSNQLTAATQALGQVAMLGAVSSAMSNAGRSAGTGTA